MEVKKTTYEIDGCEEPCFEVTSEDVKVRIAPFYHFIGKNTILVTEFLDGEWNSQEEINVDFDELTAAKAKEIARDMCVYLR